jgi:hypothetical protein
MDINSSWVPLRILLGFVDLCSIPRLSTLNLYVLLCTPFAFAANFSAFPHDLVSAETRFPSCGQ